MFRLTHTHTFSIQFERRNTDSPKLKWSKVSDFWRVWCAVGWVGVAARCLESHHLAAVYFHPCLLAGSTNSVQLGVLFLFLLAVAELLGESKLVSGASELGSRV